VFLSVFKKTGKEAAFHVEKTKGRLALFIAKQKNPPEDSGGVDLTLKTTNMKSISITTKKIVCSGSFKNCLKSILQSPF
jgi:hypothetical protein